MVIITMADIDYDVTCVKRSFLAVSALTVPESISGLLGGAGGLVGRLHRDVADHDAGNRGL